MEREDIKISKDCSGLSIGRQEHCLGCCHDLHGHTPDRLVSEVAAETHNLRVGNLSFGTAA